MYETMRGRPVAMGTSLARASQASEPCKPNQAFLSKSPGIKPIRRSASAMAGSFMMAVSVQNEVLRI